MKAKETKRTQLGLVEIPAWIKKIKVNKNLLAQYIYVYLSNQRQGTASTKTRGEVVGSTRKIYRQKGTGGARHGSRKAPIFVGGGVVGGPKPKDYSKKLTKKQRRRALIYAFSLAFKDKNIIVGKFSFNKISKTKDAVNFLRKIKVVPKKDKVLMVFDGMEEKLKRAFRNIEGVTYKNLSSLNAYDFLLQQKIVFNKDVFDKFINFLGKDETK